MLQKVKELLAHVSHSVYCALNPGNRFCDRSCPKLRIQNYQFGFTFIVYFFNEKMWCTACWCKREVGLSDRWASLWTVIVIVTEVTSFAVCRLSTSCHWLSENLFSHKVQQEQNKDDNVKHRMYKLILTVTNRQYTWSRTYLYSRNAILWKKLNVWMKN